MEAIKNLTIVTVSTGYNSSDTSIALSSGHGALLPDPATDGQFRLTWYNSSDYSNPADDPDAEIVLVTARSTDTLTVTRPASGNSYLGEGSDNTASNHNTGGKTYKMVLAPTKKIFTDIMMAGKENLLKNGNFWNNSTNGYGGTPDDWTSSSANPVQGGFPSMTKQELIDLLGVADGDIEGLWNLNEASGNATDLSSNGYNLTDNNTVASSDDGLMGKARDFETANSEFLSIASASCPNLQITQNQTFFFFYKPENVTVNQRIMGLADSGATDGWINMILLGATSTVALQYRRTGATESIESDVKLEAGKWYFIVGIYDYTNTQLRLFVNGVKKTGTPAGVKLAGTGDDFAIGRLGAYAADYLDGLIQSAGVLSVALSDTQVKKLWAYTTWKGMKVRRATSDGYLYQTLDPQLVERLRGRTLTLRAKGYKDTAGTGALISIYDGTETESAGLTGASAWENLFVTKDISATASEITIRLKAKTADGNVWYKEVALFEGALPFAFEPSKDDQTRLPRLLKQDPPLMTGGKPYQYEENVEYTFTPTSTWTGTAPTGGTNVNHKFMFSDKKCYIKGQGYSMTAGTGVTALLVTLPINPLVGASQLSFVPAHIGVADAPNLSKGEINYNGGGLNIKCSSVAATMFQYQGFYFIN